MRFWFIVIAVLTLVLLTSAAGCGIGQDSISMPIEVTNADRVGAIAFNLVYDSSVLEAQAVEVKELATGANASYSTSTPGKLLVLVQNAPNINGSGTLVVAKFKVLNTAGATTLEIEVVEALNLDTGEPVGTSVSDGSYSGTTDSVEPPIIIFG